MSAVCNLFSFMCMRETQKKKYSVKPTAHPNKQAYDAIVVLKGKENQKPKPGGISFDVILKPAASDSPCSLSPREVKRRELSQEQIENKLKRAEERRSLIEQERLEQLARERQKAIEVMNKAQCETQQFVKKTNEKLRRSMETNRENREKQIREMQERLKEHANHINEVCTASENRGPSSDDLQEHLVLKMENALKNREEQLRNLQERLAEHENKIKEVQRKKVNSSGDASFNQD